MPDEFYPLILSKWLRSLRFGNDHYRVMESSAYYSQYGIIVNDILNQPDCKVRLAVLTDDHDNVQGFSVFREDILDYIYVHKDMRRIGIAATLLPKGIKQISHLTKTGVTIWEKKYGHWVFNPFE